MNCFGLGACVGTGHLRELQQTGSSLLAWGGLVVEQTQFSLFSWPKPRQEQSCGSSPSQHHK